MSVNVVKLLTATILFESLEEGCLESARFIL